MRHCVVLEFLILILAAIGMALLVALAAGRAEIEDLRSEVEALEAELRVSEALREAVVRGIKEEW